MIKRSASYVVQVTPGLRVISMNTNACNNENFWLDLNNTDPDGELQWLVEQLQDAENNNQKVQILGHIPTGSGDCLQWWSWNYYKMINRYENTVRGQFFGHTHSDSFTLFFENANHTARATNVMYVAPSITTYSNHNPAYRIYEIDGNRPDSSYSVLNHLTYYLDIVEANKQPQVTPPWILEYSARETYSMSSLFPEDWNNLFKRFADPAHDADFVLYNRYHTTNSGHSCDPQCKRNLLCEIRQGRSGDASLCDDI